MTDLGSNGPFLLPDSDQGELCIGENCFGQRSRKASLSCLFSVSAFYRNRAIKRMRGIEVGDNQVQHAGHAAQAQPGFLGGTRNKN